MNQRERTDVVQDRLKGSWVEPAIFACEHCRAWDVTTPPVWVPDGYERDEARRWQAMCRQLHGRELLEHQRAADRFAQALSDARLRRMVES
jgi:hypothetical protein